MGDLRLKRFEFSVIVERYYIGEFQRRLVETFQVTTPDPDGQRLFRIGISRPQKGFAEQRQALVAHSAVSRLVVKIPSDHARIPRKARNNSGDVFLKLRPVCLIDDAFMSGTWSPAAIVNSGNGVILFSEIGLFTRKCAVIKEAEHGGDVVPVEEQFSAISKGIIEMGFSLGSYWTGIHPAFQVEGGMPMSFASPRAFLGFMYDYGFIDYMRDICSEQGVYYLNAHTSGAITMMTKKELSSLDDLKGFKVRAFGSYLDLMEKLNGEEYQGRRLVVNPAREKESKGPRGGGGGRQRF